MRESVDHRLRPELDGASGGDADVDVEEGERVVSRRDKADALVAREHLVPGAPGGRVSRVAVLGVVAGVRIRRGFLPPARLPVRAGAPFGMPGDELAIGREVAEWEVLNDQ